MAEPSRENTGNTTILTALSGPAIHVLDRFTNSHREVSAPRLTTYETHTVASQKQLESSGITRKGDPNSQVPAPPLTMVARRRQCTHGSTIKRRVGRSLKRAHCKRNLVTSRKQAAYKLPRTQSSFCSFKRVPGSLLRQDNSCSNRRHHSGVIYKQGRRHEVRSSLCPTMGNLDLVYQETSNSQSPTYSRPAERGSREATQARPDHPNRVVSPSRGLPNNMQQVAPALNRSICHEVQQQVASFCVTSTGSPGHSSGRTEFAMGGSGCIRLSTSSHLGQSGGEVAGLPMQQNHSDCSGVAQHGLILGSGGHVQPNPTESAHSAQPADTALQSDPSQKSDISKSPCMAPRASAIKKQGFSEAVAERIEAPQRSTRSVYEAKWTIFTKWCISNQVDFRAPPVKSVADFLMYFFPGQEVTAQHHFMVTDQPLLINWETRQLISVKMKISLVSWIVSTETGPKARGESPPGTSPWFCTS